MAQFKTKQNPERYRDCCVVCPDPALNEYTVTNTASVVTGSDGSTCELDAGMSGACMVSIFLKSTTFGTIFTIQGSIDGGTWSTITCLDELGVAHSSTITVAAGATDQAFIIPGADATTPVDCAWRFYRILADNAVDNNVATCRVWMVVK